MEIKLFPFKLTILLIFQNLLSTNFNDFVNHTEALRTSLDMVCGASSLTFVNLAWQELLLKGLGGLHYPALVSATGLFKYNLVRDFNNDFCLAIAPSDVAIVTFDQAVSLISETTRQAKNLYNSLNETNRRNLLWSEYFLKNVQNVSYASLVEQSGRVKLDQFMNSLAHLRAQPGEAAEVRRDDISAPLAGAGGPVLPAGKVAFPVGKSNPHDYAAVERHIRTNDKYSNNNFYAAVGKDWDLSQLSTPANIVEKREYPDLNKYNQGNFATTVIVLENNYNLFKSFVPVDLKTNLADISTDNTAFYVEFNAGSGFYAKGRRYNLIFHGAMADWYLPEMQAAGFNFRTHGFAKDLPMGIFDFNGIEPSGGDIAKNGLALQNVNAHNNLYSPDNAGFIIQDGRQVVTFWSLAKSPEKNRAVITFHVLFSFDLPNGFKDLVFTISRDIIGVKTLGNLLDRLSQLTRLLPDGPDQTAWANAMAFLCEMYGHRI